MFVRNSQLFASFALLCGAQVSCLTAEMSLHSHLTQGLISEQIQQSREDCEGVYYQAIEKDSEQPEEKKLFPITYNNNLVIHTDLASNAFEEAPVILRLIEWLEQSKDSGALFLLKKLNKLYYLELHQMLSGFDTHHTEAPLALQALHALYDYKVAVDGVSQAPFRSTLSKCFLTISIVNGSQYGYENRKEMLTYVLNKVKREMLEINKQTQSLNANTEVINKLILLLGILSVKEPLVKPKIARKVITVSLVVGIISFLIYRFVIPNKTQISTKISSLLSHSGEMIRDNFFKKIIDGVIDTTRDNIKRNNDLDNLKQGVSAVLDEKLDTVSNRGFIAKFLIGTTKKIEKK